VIKNESEVFSKLWEYFGNLLGMFLHRSLTIHSGASSNNESFKIQNLLRNGLAVAWRSLLEGQNLDGASSS
jgi:hypothetical protein